MTRSFVFWCAAVVGIGGLAGCASSAVHATNGLPRVPDRKPRVVVTTDPELDDSNFLIRYLLHSTDFRTEGRVYASSQFHWKETAPAGNGRCPTGSTFAATGLACAPWRQAAHSGEMSDLRTHLESHDDRIFTAPSGGRPR